jgi:hypothetical protein
MWFASLPEAAPLGSAVAMVVHDTLRIEVYYGTEMWRGKLAVIEVSAADLRLVQRWENAISACENAEDGEDNEDGDEGDDEGDDEALKMEACYANALFNEWCSTVENLGFGEKHAAGFLGFEVMTNLKDAHYAALSSASWLGEHAGTASRVVPKLLYVVRDDDIFAAL